MIKRTTQLAICAVSFILAFNACKTTSAPEKKHDSEVIYHVFQRSFYDSNGDQHGDLNGLREKLDYLQELGVTSILMVPLYESVYYHNYFASDFKKIDPRYGTMEDYLNLVKDIHKRGMKIYMDMETQYVTEDHLWYKDSYNNPSSKYSNYILYQDSAQTKPSTIVMELTGLKGYDGVTRRITTVNLRNKEVLEYNYDLFKYWVDPNGDGKFDDGVDGFRSDHMMDHLDNKPQLTDLFKEFWTPLITRLKQVNPDLNIVAEQASWGAYGIDYLTDGGVDRVFGFRLAFAIRNFNKQEINNMADTIFGLTPENKQQVIFIENHDMPRFAQVVKNNVAKEKVGAALNLLIGGVPAIYYGQEIGMTGGAKPGEYGMTDANEIPVREAFEWYKADSGKGMALWYKDSGPWWDTRNMKANDGISLEEQKDDPNSLWNYYKTLIHLRNTHVALGLGKYQTLKNDNDQVVSFLRYKDNHAAVVAVNLSDSAQHATLHTTDAKVRVTGKNIFSIHGNAALQADTDEVIIDLPANGVAVFEVKL
ncbi:alpha-amylase family glycosyl hydrolase [Chitinophaga defluvii]|uniref:Alpha-amylase family glycosyl hydrolase n=1 Tax=Chitinophaga defluvii TaxID=3163343 RepID=A0ABV2T0Y5_9BACT